MIQTTSTDFLTILNHAEADVSTHVFLCNPSQPSCGFGMDYSAGHFEERMAENPLWSSPQDTHQEHEEILVVTPHESCRSFFELLWETGGAQTDIASLTTEDID